VPDASEEKRWSWYGQVKDAAFSSAALAILGWMAYHGTWDPYGVMAALVCGGVVGAGVFNKWLERKLNGTGT
jgi:hypothetical protein